MTKSVRGSLGLTILCFTQFSAIMHWNRTLAASNIFHIFPQWIKFYTFHCHKVGIFRVTLSWRDRHIFTWQSLKILKVFNILTLKMKTFFKKLEYYFLVETTEIKNTLFLYKTALSKPNDMTNGMRSTKWFLPITIIFTNNLFINFQFFSV